jgi:ABC-type nitrate/sulfonate/bicarbonate transport system substrate-binding protein
MRHRWLLAALLALVALVGLAPVLVSASPAGQKGLRSLRLITFTTDAATIAAQAHGLFAAEGLDVDITITPNSTVQMRGLGQGEWDVASTAFDNVLAWSGRDNGPAIAAIVQTAAGVNLPVYVRPEIQDWADLRGKPLAVDAVDTAFALVLRRILLAHDLDLGRGDYEFVAIGGTPLRLESMARGDTFAGVMSSDLESRAQAAGLRRVADQREVLPDYPGGVFAVSRSWAQQHRDETMRFIRGWLAGNRWVHANREAAIELVSATQGTPREAATRAVDELSANGALNVAGLESVIGLRTQFGYPLAMGNDVARFYDTSYYQQAAGR